jgi:hypothetical protein
MTPLLLGLALIQAPSPPKDLAPGDLPESVPVTEPVLAPRAAVPAGPIPLRLSSTDAWGCVYGSSYYCRHRSAVTYESRVLQSPAADPCPWTGECVAVYPSGSSLNPGRFVAWEWRWGPIMEFMETSRGLIDGRRIMEARARDAAARDVASSSRQTSVSASTKGGGSYNPPTQSYSPPAASAGAVYSGARPAGKGLE